MGVVSTCNSLIQTSGRADVRTGEFTSDGKRDTVCVGQMGGAVGEGDFFLYPSL